MNKSQTVKVYADTSVFGGIDDEEFLYSSREFFEEVTRGRFQLVISPLIEEELAGAPETVRLFFEQMAGTAESAVVSKEALTLRDAYIKAGIVTKKSLTDALHVSLATIAACRMIVSWNFRHIVHFDKIPLYNEVNRTMGYQEIAIHSPQEVIDYEDQDV